MAIKLTPGSIPLVANFTDSNPPICNHVYRFDMQSTEKAVFEFFLVESQVFSKADIARVTLPLSWFPKDQVVTQWFPLKPVKPGTGDLLVLCEIHLCFNGSPEFQAPPGSMLVKPCWQVPAGLPVVSGMGVMPPPISSMKMPPYQIGFNQPTPYHIQTPMMMGQMPQMMNGGLTPNPMMMNQNPQTLGSTMKPDSPWGSPFY